MESLEEFEALQDDVKRLHDWSTTWQLPFNLDKCKVVHIGKNKEKREYVTVKVVNSVIVNNH